MIAVAAGLAILAGCQTAPPSTVLARLPDPALTGAAPPMAAAAENVTCDPAPCPEATPVPAGWNPAGGLSARWKAIVIHHSASATGSLRDIDSWHRGQGWDSCGYHFVIGNGTHSGDGEVEVGARWRDQATGAHTRLFGAESSPDGNYYNEHGIGIVLVGNFETAPPSARQMEALVRLTSHLASAGRIGMHDIFLHGELKSTNCPGQYFSKAQLRRRLALAMTRIDVTLPSVASYDEKRPLAGGAALGGE